MARSPLFARQQPGGMFAISQDGPLTTGDVWYVDSATGTDGAGYGRNPDAPLATVDYAVGLCTASKGDTIYVMPGHAETISGATGLVLDVAGVRVVGMGWGALRPTFTFSNTASILSITAANCAVENIRIVGNVDNIVTGISLGASADGAVLRNVVMIDGAANKEFLIGIAIAAACHNVTLDGVQFFGLGGGATGCVVTAGSSDNLIMRNCYMQGTFSGSLVDGSAAALVNQFIASNILLNYDTSAGLVYKGHASSTGALVYNFVGGAKNNTQTVNTVTAMHCAENYGTDVAATSAILTPSTLTAWA